MPFFQLHGNYVPLICNQIMAVLVDKNNRNLPKLHTYIRRHTHPDTFRSKIYSEVMRTAKCRLQISFCTDAFVGKYDGE